MKPTPIIDMFSGTGELARTVADGLNEFTCFQSFSDNYGPAREYLKVRFHNGHGETIASTLSRDLEDEEIRLIQTWEDVTGVYAPPTGQTCQFMHWMMGLPYRGLDSLGLSVSAQRRRQTPGPPHAPARTSRNQQYRSERNPLMPLNDYDYEIVRADGLEPGDFIWYVGRPCRIFDVSINERTTSFTAITGIGMYSSSTFVRPNDEPQVKILNSGVLF